MKRIRIRWNTLTRAQRDRESQLFRPRHLVHWVTAHPGGQAVAVFLAMALCIAAFLVMPPDSDVGREVTPALTHSLSVPERQSQSSPTVQPPMGQATVSSATTPSTAPATTTSTRSPQHVVRIVTVPIVSKTSVPPTQTTDPGNAGDQVAAGGQVDSAAPGSPSTASVIARDVDPALVDIDASLSEGREVWGTGIVLTSSGEILTNDHVVSGSSQVSVTDVGNGQTYRAEVVGGDQGADLAVLQLVGASGLAIATSGDSSSVLPGEGVVAVGNANNAGGTPSYAGGSITALHQHIVEQNDVDGSSQPLGGLIETDTELLPGESGGPLVDTSGDVVGVDTAFSSDVSSGFAIPINSALTVAETIVAAATNSSQ